MEHGKSRVFLSRMLRRMRRGSRSGHQQRTQGVWSMFLVIRTLRIESPNIRVFAQASLVYRFKISGFVRSTAQCHLRIYIIGRFYHRVGSS